MRTIFDVEGYLRKTDHTIEIWSEGKKGFTVSIKTRHCHGESTKTFLADALECAVVNLREEEEAAAKRAKEREQAIKDGITIDTSNVLTWNGMPITPGVWHRLP